MKIDPHDWLWWREHVEFYMTCGACPEQYDVMLDDEQIAYVRLRWGRLSVHVPDHGSEEIYSHSFEDGSKGCFVGNEAERFKLIILWRLYCYYTGLLREPDLLHELMMSSLEHMVNDQSFDRSTVTIADTN